MMKSVRNMYFIRNISPQYKRFFFTKKFIIYAPLLKNTYFSFHEGTFFLKLSEKYIWTWTNILQRKEVTGVLTVSFRFKISQILWSMFVLSSILFSLWDWSLFVIFMVSYHLHETKVMLWLLIYSRLIRSFSYCVQFYNIIKLLIFLG